MLFTVSCDDDDDNPIDPNAPTTVETWTLELSPDAEIPMVENREETGIVTLTLLSDNTLTYTIDVDNLLAGDVLTMAHIHTGMPTENGDVVKGLISAATEFDAENRANGVISLTEAEVDAIQETNTHYVNVHSEQVPSGLLRANIGPDIDWAMDVDLDVDAENNGAMGMTYLRKSGDLLFYHINVEGIGTNDTLEAAHIHEGAAGVNGSVIIPLYSTSEFMPEMLELNDAQINTLLTDPTYVNVHTKDYPTGIVRGQIR
jgi:hypothetical protein